MSPVTATECLFVGLLKLVINAMLSSGLQLSPRVTFMDRVLSFREAFFTELSCSVKSSFRWIVAVSPLKDKLPLPFHGGGVASKLISTRRVFDVVVDADMNDSNKYLIIQLVAKSAIFCVQVFL